MMMDELVWRRCPGGWELSSPKAMANGGKPITISKNEGYSMIYGNRQGIGYRIGHAISAGMTPEGEPLKDVTPSP